MTGSNTGYAKKRDLFVVGLPRWVSISRRTRAAMGWQRRQRRCHRGYTFGQGGMRHRWNVSRLQNTPQLRLHYVNPFGVLNCMKQEYGRGKIHEGSMSEQYLVRKKWRNAEWIEDNWPWSCKNNQIHMEYVSRKMNMKIWYMI